MKTSDQIIGFPSLVISVCFTRLRRFLRILAASCERFYWGNGFSRAASMAYTTLLSLLPFFAVGFGFLAAFAVSKSYIPKLQDYIITNFVPDPDVARQILAFLTDFSGKLTTLGSRISIPMIAFFIFTSILLINSIESALNETWQVYQTRPITHRIAIFCAVVLMAPVLALSVYVFVELRVQPLLQEVLIGAYFQRLCSHLVPFLIAFTAFWILYWVVPKAQVKWKSALIGAFVTALLFSIAFVSFALYVERYASYNKLYGTLAAIPIFLVWLYLFWTIVLYGAEVSFQAQYLPESGRVLKTTVYSVGDGLLLIGLQTLIRVAGCYFGGRPMPDEFEVAEELGCSTVVLKRAVDKLEKAGLLTRGDLAGRPLTLLRGPDTITFSDVCRAFTGTSGALRYPSEMGRFFSAYQDSRSLNSTTLQELARKTKEA